MDDVLEEEQCVQVDGGPLSVLCCFMSPVHVSCKILEGQRGRAGA